MKKLTLYFLILISIFSCKKDEENNLINCDGSNNDFKTFYTSLINSDHEDIVSMDTEIHEYSFVLSKKMSICKIGYQSYPEIKNRAYLIQLIDSANANILLSKSQVFSSNETSYFAPTTEIFLDTNVVYTLKRIQTNWAPYNDYTIGRYAKKGIMDFPYSNGILKITSSNFHQNGGPANNFAIPFIDIVFK